MLNVKPGAALRCMNLRKQVAVTESGGVFWLILFFVEIIPQILDQIHVIMKTMHNSEITGIIWVA